MAFSDKLYSTSGYRLQVLHVPFPGSPGKVGFTSSGSVISSGPYVAVATAPVAPHSSSSGSPDGPGCSVLLSGKRSLVWSPREPSDAFAPSAILSRSFLWATHCGLSKRGEEEN